MQSNFSKLFQNKIFLFSIGIFTLICLLFGVYFYNNKGKSTNSKQNSQISTNSNSNSQINSSNSLLDSNNSQISFSNSSFSQNSFQNSNNLTNSSQKVENLLTNSDSNSNLIPNNSQTYTNPNYPNLKINYDNSWKIERKAFQNYDPFNIENKGETNGLNSGQIILTKNNTKLEFYLEMAGGPIHDNTGFDPNNIDSKTDFDIFERRAKYLFTDKDKNNIFYDYKFKKNTSSCQESAVINWSNRSIKTNINFESNVYKRQSMSGKVVTYKEIGDVSCDNKLLFNLNIALKSTNPSEIKEADEIIKNSILE